MSARRKDEERNNSGGVASRRLRGGGAWALLLVSVILAAGAVWSVSRRADEKLPTVRSADAWDAARIAFADRDLRGAEARLRELLAAQPDRREARLLLGRVLCERGRIPEAREIFTALSASQPDPESLRGLGAVSEKDRRYDLAASYYHRAIDLRKEDPSLWRDLGRAQAAGGNAVGALSSVQESLRLDPAQADLVVLRGELAASLQAPPPRAPGSTEVGKAGRPAELPTPLQPRVPDPSRMFPKPDGRTR